MGDGSQFKMRDHNIAMFTHQLTKPVTQKKLNITETVSCAIRNSKLDSSRRLTRVLSRHSPQSREEETMKSVRDLVTIMPLGTPYFSYLEAVTTGSHPPQLDWETAYENWAVGHGRTVVQSQLTEKTATALSAFDACPEQSTANTVYTSLAVQNLELGEFLKSRTPSLKAELNLAHMTTRLLLDIATETPHRVVFVNAVAWLVVLVRDLDPALIQTAAFDDALTDEIWW
ncbi:MAG: hypothetical protein RIC89_12880, partial [Pseudomonadales bacterium]